MFSLFVQHLKLLEHSRGHWVELYSMSFHYNTHFCTMLGNLHNLHTLDNQHTLHETQSSLLQQYLAQWVGLRCLTAMLQCLCSFSTEASYVLCILVVVPSNMRKPALVLWAHGSAALEILLVHFHVYLHEPFSSDSRSLYCGLVSDHSFLIWQSYLVARSLAISCSHFIVDWIWTPSREYDAVLSWGCRVCHATPFSQCAPQIFSQWRLRPQFFCSSVKRITSVMLSFISFRCKLLNV